MSFLKHSIYLKKQWLNLKKVKAKRKEHDIWIVQSEIKWLLEQPVVEKWEQTTNEGRAKR